jgi:hypothetical protein
MSFYSRELAGLKGSKAAQWYGAALAATLPLTSRLWWPTFAQLGDGAPGRIPRPGLDWLYVPNLSPVFFQLWLLGIAAAGIAAAVAFLSGRERAGLAALAVGTAAKLAYFALDLRHMGNYHEMPMLSTLAYLVAPSRLRLQRDLLVAYYLAAGMLKLNGEWLSGAAIPPAWIGPRLYGFLFVRERWLLALGTHWVVFLELFMVLWLLHPSRKWRMAIFAQLVLFHAVSFLAVGTFYPSIMACLLAVVPLLEMYGPGAPNGWFGWSALTMFAFFQILPLTGGVDPALARENTLLALNMFDSRPDCTSTTIVRETNRTLDLTFDVGRLAPRIACEPAIYIRRALELCDDLGPAAEVDLEMQSRRRVGISFHVWIDERDICRRRPQVKVWGRNAWLRR